MKIILKFLIGAIVGFAITYGVLLGTDHFKSNFNLSLNFDLYANSIALLLVVVVFGLCAFSLQYRNQIKLLSKQTFAGEEEDRVDELINNKFYDFSYFTTAGITISLFVVCMVLIMDLPNEILIAAIIGFASSFLISISNTSLMKQVYPDREMPSTSDPDYADKLLNMSDEGERHIILHGLFKAYNSANAYIFVAIILALFYSIATGSNQIFSIALMTIILLIINGKYVLSIRNK
ncbi:DUF3169 family protein [Lysinibacillus sp. 54212]|uniref:DUF3169 family protein n=1 Tax=Lysinibacillus sp. 54212 TaxID=3119829 RepID=UPI002FCC0502